MRTSWTSEDKVAWWAFDELVHADLGITTLVVECPGSVPDSSFLGDSSCWIVANHVRDTE